MYPRKQEAESLSGGGGGGEAEPCAPSRMVQASPKGHPPARGAPGWPGFVAAGPAEGQALASCLAFRVSLASRCWPWAGSSGLALCQFAPSSLWGLPPSPRCEHRAMLPSAGPSVFTSTF